LFAANQGSDTVLPFKVDQKTGKLTPSREPISVPKPVRVLFVEGAVGPSHTCSPLTARPVFSTAWTPLACLLTVVFGRFKVYTS